MKFGSALSASLLLALGGSTACARTVHLSSSQILYLDGPREFSLVELHRGLEGPIRSFADCLCLNKIESANRALNGIRSPDVRQYLSAYRDFERATPRQFAESLTQSGWKSGPLYRLTGIKALIEDGKLHPSGVNAGNLLKVLPDVQPASALEYVVKAEVTLMCGQDGLSAARSLYETCNKKYGPMPWLMNRESELLESQEGIIVSGSRRTETIPPEVNRAVKVRLDILKKFPNFEANYFFLANDYAVLDRPDKMKKTLSLFLKRFDKKASYYARCKAMFAAHS